jgi:hypothetical protein
MLLISERWALQIMVEMLYLRRVESASDRACANECLVQAHYPLVSDSSALIVYSLGIAVWSTAFLEVRGHLQTGPCIPG